MTTNAKVTFMLIFPDWLRCNMFVDLLMNNGRLCMSADESKDNLRLKTYAYN